MTTQRKARTAPEGYAFTDEDFRWYWRPTPHFHVFEDNCGDIEGLCFVSEAQAKRVLWKVFQRSDYDHADIESYTHRVTDGSIEIHYTDGKEITLSLMRCETADDCYMVEEVAEQTPAVA